MRVSNKNQDIWILILDMSIFLVYERGARPQDHERTRHKSRGR